jgi:mannose-6-phosphate isomerase-like protein (cupin superfamily)
MQIANLAELDSFTTLDGSTIRELAGPAWTDARNQSLAEASVPAGGETAEHYHPRSEEIYYFAAGAGRMRLGEDEGDVRAGDCVVIPPGTPHKLWSTGGRAAPHTPIATYLVSRYSPIPSKPPSRPNPDCFTPPNGAAGLDTTPWFSPTIPVSIASQTWNARARSRV